MLAIIEMSDFPKASKLPPSAAEFEKFTLPGVWDDVGDGCYVRRYSNTSDFLEAGLLPNGLLRLQAKAAVCLGWGGNAVQCVLEKLISPRDAEGIESAVIELENRLVSDANR